MISWKRAVTIATIAGTGVAWGHAGGGGGGYHGNHPAAQSPACSEGGAWAGPWPPLPLPLKAIKGGAMGCHSDGGPFNYLSNLPALFRFFVSSFLLSPVEKADMDGRSHQINTRRDVHLGLKQLPRKKQKKNPISPNMKS